jgi:uncharacterized DUF497 family protein
MAGHTFPDGFEWDEAKRQVNFAKHGIDFVDALVMFDGFVVDEPDRRRDYGEERRLALGEVNGRILLVVYTRRDGNRRLISARRASDDERKKYFADVT